ncbi:MAG: cbb3-type cytochrome oxidase assembly protein CcoS [Rubrivivax sp.]
MDILYLLIPLSVLVVLGLMAVFGWALHAGQFDDLQREGERILHPDEADASEFDRHQARD